MPQRDDSRKTVPEIADDLAPADPHLEHLHPNIFDPEELEPDDLDPRPITPVQRRRIVLAASLLLLLLLAAVLPPLVSMDRFRRQIASAIGASLGRPVHLDSVTLNILPLPGFTLQNFVVGEDPAFGFEPVIHANSVRVTLRARSLWRGRMEFSRISLDEPTSVNLVHLPDGRWNIEGILLQASRMPAAPTAQKIAGDTPRFPYIEATGARVNLKMGLEKMPISLTDADFALWLPQPETWRLRLEAHPSRTDAAAADTGILRIEGTLGKSTTLQDLPVDLHAAWSAAPLGAVSSVLLGRDAGLRGDLTLNASLLGTVGYNALETHLTLKQLRLSEFVPPRTLDLDLACRAETSRIFRTLHQIHCAAPSNTGSPTLTLSADLPDLARPSSSVLEANLNNLPAEALLDTLRALSPRTSPQLNLTGSLAAHLTCCAGTPTLLTSFAFTATQTRLSLADTPAFLEEDLTGEFAAGQIALHPLHLDLGGPSSATLEVHLDRTGYTMHLSGLVRRIRLLSLAHALPLFGDGLDEALHPLADTSESPINVDLVATRPWRLPGPGSQLWSPAPPITRPTPTRRLTHRH